MKQNKVVVKNFNLSCNPNDIVEDLFGQGYNAVKGINKL